MRGRPITIYTITHVASGKVYVGQTRNPNQRWAAHQSKPPVLMRNDAAAAKQQGQSFRDAFRFQAVDTVLTDQEAHEIEGVLIRQLRDQDVQLYNRVTGDPARTRIFWAVHHPAKRK